MLPRSKLSASGLMAVCDGGSGGELASIGTGLVARDWPDDRFPADLVARDSFGHGRLGGAMMRRFGEKADRQKKQASKRQKGRYGGVRTHLDFGGAERQSIFYVKDRRSIAEVTKWVPCTGSLTVWGIYAHECRSGKADRSRVFRMNANRTPPLNLMA
jgi:hypothetical protein